jgi:hypothetical protein
LANGVAMRVVWGKGIGAAINPGVVTRVQQRYPYQVRPVFAAEFSCERERASAPCMPIRPLRLQFSSPIPKQTATLIRLRPPTGEALTPVFDKDDQSAEVGVVAFPSPLKEKTAYTIELPRDVKDAAGRALANAASFPLKVATGEAPPIAKFAAAPFGIVELKGDAMLPVTLRQVQADLRPAAGGAAPRGSVRVKRLDTDADILAWYTRLQAYHEAQMTARELGLPERPTPEAGSRATRSIAM